MITMRKISSVLFLLMFICGHAGPLHGADQKSQLTPFCLGPEDVLEISVWKDEALTRKVLVRPDGKISFPLIGDIQAQGRTVEELRQAVKNKMKAFVPDASVSVILVLGGQGFQARGVYYGYNPKGHAGAGYGRRDNALCKQG